MSVHDLLSRGIGVVNADRLDSHKADIKTMQDAGFSVQDCITFIEVNVAAFKLLGRGDFDTVCPGTHPDDPNCRAYPTPDGGWNISRYGTTKEKPGWETNSQGYAFYRYPGPKTVIDLSDATEKEIEDRTSQALTQTDAYQRGGVLVRILTGSPPPPHVDRPKDTPAICPMPRSAIRAAISEAVDFKRFDVRKKKTVRSPQPGWLAECIADRGRYAVPTIEGVSVVPQFLPDGSILTRRGYDPNTGIFYAPNTNYGDVMSVQDALATLDDVLCDFPFAMPAHKSAVLSAMLTLLARPAFTGCCPLILVEGNRPGCGKGLLGDVIATIGIGSTFARTTAPTSEDEWRKRLTSVFMAAEPAILLDNLTGKLKSPTLDAALTSTSWSDRLLGRNQTVRVPMATIFFATGNNLTLHADTVRRTLHIRLESQLERPEQRNDCHHQPLLSYVHVNRGRLTAASLSLLHHYHAARRPDQGLKPWGSFEGWGLIRNVLVWCGMPDPMETLTELQKQNDDESPLLRMLLDGWEEAGGKLTAKEAVDASYEVADHHARYPKLAAAIDEIEGRDKRQSLGITLSKFKGVRLGGRYFSRVDGRSTTWEVRAA